jgi:hypothetical protein
MVAARGGGLVALQHGVHSGAPMTATIKSHQDPDCPGRAIHRISGTTKGIVQDAIDVFMREVEEKGGLANFIGPYRAPVGYLAIGEVFIVEREAVA